MTTHDAMTSCFHINLCLNALQLTYSILYLGIC